ncbi:M48 family metalloprotease [Anditalea andensis]|uniref:Peptidase M48 n=1 Tax=Anditalea andensis TaxID=1048983 RepID=A0A074L4I0_9BACT|nr:M48 family metalloprotease [Anditalea andensis]KEO75400.1 peptidase M48 [Anditalea andensis]
MEKFKLFNLVVLLFIVCSCARNPVTGKLNFVTISEKQEIAMGQEYDPQIVAMYGLYEDEILQDFIDLKGQEMAAISHRPHLAYEFKIMDSPILNAFAVPGGYVYFTRGIMAHFNNEAEFAGVLGHEIGHITARHSVRQQSKSVLAQLGMLVGLIAVPELGQFLDPASQALELLFLKYGRDAERESDRLGVEYSSTIGYDAREMAGFFRTLERQRVSSGRDPLPDFLSTHPSPTDRNKDVAALAGEWQSRLNLNEPKVNRNEYLKKIEGLIYGEDPKQGFVENSVFYHPELKFNFPVPKDWTLQNTPQQVQMAPKEGNALLMLTLATGKTTKEAAEQVASQYALQVTASEARTVNGLNAIRVMADQKEQQNPLRVLYYIIQQEANMYLMLGAAPLNNFPNFEVVFEQSMTGFAPLTDAEKLNRQPERIVLKANSIQQAFGEFLKSNQVPAIRWEELGILNGLKSEDIIEKGTLIKLVE